MTKDQILEAIKGMNVLELSDMVQALEEEFGITAAAPVAVAIAGGADSAAATDGAAAEEEQIEFAVSIKEIGPNKINVIKAVREVTSLGLREAKELVESAPARVRESVPKEEAATIKSKLEDAGAVVEVN